MAYKYDPTIEPNIKALILQLTNFKEDTEIFNYIHDYFLKTLRRVDSAFCVTKNEIDLKVEGLSEKLIFHGFLQESESFKTVYTKFMSSSANEEDLNNKMAVMQFLFAMSRSPTTHLAALPKGLNVQQDDKGDDIDWGKYLLEGIEVWKPNFDDSDDLSNDEASESSGHDSILQRSISHTFLNTQNEVNCAENLNLDTFENCRLTLRKSVQNTWFTASSVRELPDVDDSEANIALRWESFLSNASHGLIGGPHTKLITEYKVIREILWQLMAPHNSVVFSWRGDDLVINDDVSIPSLRPVAFKNLASAFLPDILMLHELRTFHWTVLKDDHAPHTYCGYSNAVMSILQPVTAELARIELKVIEQETTQTIISLGNNLKLLLKDLKYLHGVHKAVILNYRTTPRHTCAAHLLTTLYAMLPTSYEKSQMDILLTLYLESAYKYIRLIEEWFRTNRLQDVRREFPLVERHIEGYDDDEDDDNLCASRIADGVDKKTAFERTRYIIRESNLKFPDDPVISIIKKEVMQIARHLRLFSLLGKLSLLHETKFCIYDDWCEAVFDLLKKYSGITTNAICDPLVVTSEEPVAPANVNNDVFDLLEHFGDTSDGFLMAAFQDVFHPDQSLVDVKSKSTYDKLQEIGTRNLPGIQIFVADFLGDILENKYRNCGQILKDLFLRDYQLAEQLAIMSKVFLFADDAIFPFYRSVFAKIESNATWGNDIWLTYDLQDVLADAHPKLHEKVRVGVRPGWASLLEDPLRTCTLIDVQYVIDWPIDIIVSERSAKMYRELFYFVLKIKWAVHTLNHLRYSRAEQRRNQRAPKYVRLLLHRLDMLRCGYINVFAAMQHYVLGYVYRVCRERFEREFEAAKDLESLVRCHEDFIEGYHRLVARVRDYQEKAFGFDRALYSVRQLRKMWLSPGDIFDKMLKKTEDSLKECHRNIFEVISVQVYD